MNKERILAFTDAVVAIIMTIMVLEIKAPEEATLEALVSQLPYYCAFLLSSVSIYFSWLHHHNLFNTVKKVSLGVFWANGLWLLGMALIPMATSWLSKNVNAFLPEFFYFIVYCVWSVAYYVLDNRIFAYQNRIGKTMQREGIIRHFWIDLALFLIGIILIPIIPISGVILTIIQMSTWTIVPYIVKA